MTGSTKTGALVLAAWVGLAACSRNAVVRGVAEPPGGTVVIRPSSSGLPNEVGRYPYTAADVHFMSGMIPHHAQAVLIASWAPTHDASAALRVICERVVVAQRDEIASMRSWLRQRGEPVPDSNATHLRMKMGTVEHEMLMPGMLSADELAQLDAARGTQFERLFLTFMIRHHEGALTMVNELFASPGAAQDERVYKLASDIFADQTTEIERMQKMLETLTRSPQ